MRHYTVADGLPSLEVHCVFQDSRGKIWFGTDVGVSCYDGVSFINYTRRDNLPDHTIFGITEDRAGRIWFRSYNGLPSWFDGEKIIQPPVNVMLSQRLKGCIVMSEELDDHDTLWIGLKNDLKWLKIPPGYTRIIESHNERCIQVKEIRAGHIFATEPRPATQFAFQPFGKAAQNIPEYTGEVWPFAAACLPANRYIIQMGFSRYLVSGTKINLLVDSVNVTFIYPEKNGNYWLCGSRPGGARLMRAGKDKDEMVQHYLEEYDVTGCLRDHEGGLWFTTIDNGVFYIPFPEMHDIYSLPLVTGDHVTALTNWPCGGVLMGTMRGKIFLAENGSCSTWQQQQRADGDCINCMSTIGNSVFTGATLSSNIYNCSTHQTIPLSGFPPGKPEPAIKCVLAYDDHRWCAATLSKLVWIDKETGKTETLLDKLPERITSIARTRGDTLWLGGFTRLWMLVPGQQPVDWSLRYPVLAQQADELIGDTISGRLWILSRSSGIFALTSYGITEINAQHSELPLVCREMLLVNQSLWVGTNAGVWELKMDGGKSSLRKFDRSNGLPANDVNHICVSGNRVWASGDGKLFGFQPGKYPENKIPPQISFRAIFCNDQSLFPGKNDEAAEFHFTENTFGFRLSGQTYKSCGHPKFLVRLFGVDEWHELDESSITYYNLPPGNYRFMAYALNNSGVRSLAPVSYSFSVLPPLWKRDWFVAIILAVIIFLTYWFVRNYLERFKREETYHRSMAELEITAIRAQMNPHFIFNAINSIYNFVLTGDRKASASYVARFARLIRNVLEFASLKKISLERELETLRLYMDIEQLRFGQAFEYEIKVDPALHPSSVQVVPMILQPYVENAIWHGLSPKDGKGKVKISVEKKDDALVCRIEDDGVGRKEAAQIPQPGIAKEPLSSKLNYRRLALLQDIYGIRFDVQYIDHYRQDGKPAGTTVVLNFPFILNT